ncbi:MAG: Sua5/YciO/YrdC/YwlC family protein [Actinomycetes bacterium]|jgi:L-threonylcarbamoyladenylate synthase
MSNSVKLTARNKTAVRDRSLVALLQGEVIVVAAEHGYFYLCDAFNQIAVNRIHELRGDQPGTAAQVLIGKVNAVSGLAMDFDSDWQKVVGAFWPGLLTIQLAPQAALSWDLGDGRALTEFAVRVPQREFLLSLLAKSGPLAAASASIAGQAPNRDMTYIPAMPDEVALMVDEGVLPEGSASTVLRREKKGGPIVAQRLGAISLEQLQVVLPTIVAHKP